MCGEATRRRSALRHSVFLRFGGCARQVKEERGEKQHHGSPRESVGFPVPHLGSSVTWSSADGQRPLLAGLLNKSPHWVCAKPGPRGRHLRISPGGDHRRPAKASERSFAGLDSRVRASSDPFWRDVGQTRANLVSLVVSLTYLRGTRLDSTGLCDFDGSLDKIRATSV